MFEGRACVILQFILEFQTNFIPQFYAVFICVISDDVRKPDLYLHIYACIHGYVGKNCVRIMSHRNQSQEMK